jgi:prenyltransferase/squalene oxidase-like repeat protein
MPMSAGRSIRTIRWSIQSLLVLLVLLAPPSVHAQDATPAAGSAVANAAAWLRSQQAADGGFPGASGTSDAGTTADAVLALAAARNAGVTIDLTKALTYLQQNALVYTQTGPGEAANLVLAIVAAGGDPTNVEKVNPLSIVEVSANSATGMIGFGPYDHALGILALVATGTTVPPAAIDVFHGTQLDDGSWSFDGTTTSGGGDTNTTAIVIQALVAAGQGSDPMVGKALAYLKTTQTESGGFPYQPGQTPKGDADSTAIVVQAILAAGQDPASPDWKNAAAALAAFQNPSGAFRYTDDEPDDNLFATVQAIPAIAGQPYPIAPRAGDGTDLATPAA